MLRFALLLCCCASNSDCNDFNVCTDDVCDSVAGCQNIPNFGSCSDGSVCTTNDSCLSNGACLGTAVNCNDGNQCTNDTCDPSNGCQHTIITGPCNDLTACTTNDTCQANGVCLGIPANCDDGNVCTDDSCDPANGCQHIANLGPCSNGDPCQVNVTCQANGDCRGTPIDCDDGIGCTIDTCEQGGCVNLAPVSFSIDFDTFPDGTPVPDDAGIFDQYEAVGARFSSNLGSPLAIVTGEAHTEPHVLIGNDRFDPITVDIVDPITGQQSATFDVQVIVISAGDNTYTATAFGPDLTTVVDQVSISNPGTDVGLGNQDLVELSSPSGIARLVFDYTQIPNPNDGIGIDTLRAGLVTAQGDMDGDGLVTILDWGDMAGCISGPCPVTPCPTAFIDVCCQRADLDGDGDVDNRDVSGFLGRFESGQNDITVLVARSSVPVVADFSGQGVVSGILSLPGAGQAAESFLGQTVTLVGDFEEVGGFPSIPLTLDTPVMNDGLWLFNDELQGEAGGTPDILVGEGAISFLFDADQTEMGLSVNLMDGGTTTFQFFSRTGAPFSPVQVSHTGNSFYTFLSSLGATFAGVTITNDDLFGISVDELRLGN